MFDGWSGAGCSGTGTCAVTMTAAKEVHATFTAKYKLTVTKSGAGSGEVTSSPSGIACGGDCEEEYLDGTPVTLSQTADSGSRFKEWTGACSGSGACEVTMSAAKSVGAVYVKTYELTVTKSGSGLGRSHQFARGHRLRRRPAKRNSTKAPSSRSAMTADSSSRFKEWTGACTGSGACEVTMSEAKSLGAVYVKTYALTVTKSGTGTGEVTSSPAGVACGATCSHEFDEGTVVTLSHAADSGSRFKEWTGACTGSGACEVTMSEAKSVGAVYVKTYALTVTKSGTGSGEVSSSPAGIACGATCSHEFDEGAVVTLSHTADSGSEFVEWTGACTGSGACEVTMSEAKSVDAVIDATDRTLTLDTTGGGHGSFQCREGAGSFEACQATYTIGAELTVKAVPDGSSDFAGWEEGAGSAASCSGTADCAFTLGEDSSLKGKFTLKQRALTIDKAGSGDGSFQCNSGSGFGPCAATYPDGTTIAVEATPDAHSTFSGWSGGGCSGTGACEVSAIGADTTLTATFAAKTHTLTIETVGPGSGSVSCDGGPCASSYPEGSKVTLHASPDSGSSFFGWAGAGCYGSGDCVVTLDRDTTVAASFEVASTEGEGGEEGKPGAGTAFPLAAGLLRGKLALVRVRCRGAGSCLGKVRLVVRLRIRRVVHRHGRRHVMRRTRNVVIGAGRLRIAAGKTGWLKLHLNRRGRRLAHRAGRRGLVAILAGKGVKNRPVRLRPRHRGRAG